MTKKFKIKNYIVRFEPTDHQQGIITITPKSQLKVRETEKPSLAFSHA